MSRRLATDVGAELVGKSPGRLSDMIGDAIEMLEFIWNKAKDVHR
jgi:hypothetical protein